MTIYSTYHIQTEITEKKTNTQGVTKFANQIFAENDTRNTV